MVDLCTSGGPIVGVYVECVGWALSDGLEVDVSRARCLIGGLLVVSVYMVGCYYALGG